MDLKKIFLRLKNGKDITTYYKKNSDISYTVRLSFQNGLFKLHSYYFDGNDVYDDQNYKDEFIAEVLDLDALIELVTKKFPGIDILL